MTDDKSLPASEGRLKRFVENLPGIAYRCRPTAPWEMEFVGGRVRATTGYPAAAFESGEIAYGDIVLDADVEELRREIRDGVEYRSQFSASYRIRTREGEVRHVFERGAPVVEDDDVEALEGIVIDVTDRKESKRRLRRQNELFTNTQRLADVGGWELDVRNDELRWTDQVKRIHGVSRDSSPTVEDAIGFYHPEDRPEIRSAVERAIEDGEPFDRTLRIQTDDGEQRWVRVRGSPTAIGGRVVRLSGAIQDVTDSKQREQLLRLLHRLLRHNLRNDLNVIRGYTDTLGEELPGGESTEYAERIETAATNLLKKSETAKELLDISLNRRETQRTVDLRELLDRIAEELRGRYPRAEIRVRADDSAVLEGDRRLDALFEQLLENAIEHSDCDAPRVEVTANASADEVRVEIADDGPGIPPEEWSVVVEEDETDSTPLRHGSGVGLLLASVVVDDYGGDLECDNASEGGAAVTVRLPR
ncbi:PAS domain-containing protein [Natronoarchaeum mannanilyticum]|uniref:histidine kinase n=1 Tax=Natronoarchaeum mannanilyticum TaxID=926360 RepID=A0AAV3TAM8_9EURY